MLEHSRLRFQSTLKGNRNTFPSRLQERRAQCLAGMLNKEAAEETTTTTPKRNCILLAKGVKARKAFDEALQREHGGDGAEFRKKVTESLEGLDRKGRKGTGYSDLY